MRPCVLQQFEIQIVKYQCRRQLEVQIVNIGAVRGCNNTNHKLNNSNSCTNPINDECASNTNNNDQNDDKDKLAIRL